MFKVQYFPKLCSAVPTNQMKSKVQKSLVPRGSFQLLGYVMKVFAVLQKLKGLRGTAFDLFGYTEERKLERADVQDYLSVLEKIKSGLTNGNYDTAVELCELPSILRGFGPVKAASREKLNAQQVVLWEQFRSGNGKLEKAA